MFILFYAETVIKYEKKNFQRKEDYKKDLDRGMRIHLEESSKKGRRGFQSGLNLQRN